MDKRAAAIATVCVGGGVGFIWLIQFMPDIAFVVLLIAGTTAAWLTIYGICRR